MNKIIYLVTLCSRKGWRQIEVFEDAEDARYFLEQQCRGHQWADCSITPLFLK